jgi:serine/threonine protein kinase
VLAIPLKRCLLQRRRSMNRAQANASSTITALLIRPNRIRGSFLASKRQTIVSTITKAGRYELREELGRGAMGVVYRAHDPVIGRDVAVKTMHLSEEGTGMSRGELVGRFQTEARAAGLLAHPNIVAIYDAGEEEGLFYITMEMVEGRSLQTLIDARQLFPLPRVMRLMEQVCSALDFAHQHNVVHRDIKPANLVLTADDVVKITDFGTAKILQFGTAQTVHVMGTPSYMSPEQVKGKPVDGRSDIFSLGVILYELMTGEKPFPGQNITTVIYKIINEDPIPPRSLDSSIHPGLSAVISRALAKGPGSRFQTCRELLDALKNYHEMVSPEKSARMAVVPAQTTAPVVRTRSFPARTSNAPSTTQPQEAETPLQFISPDTLKAEEASKKRGSMILSLILLGVIGFAGYRIWPPMMDLWQRAHEPLEQAVAQHKSAHVAPAANSETSDTKSDLHPDSSLQTAPVAQTPATEAKPTRAAPSAAISMEKPAAPEKSAASVSGPAPAANAVDARLHSELVNLSFQDKVNVRITSNTVILSGRLTPAEHLLLLNRLHWIPSSVRVIDDLGNAGDPE